MAKQLAQEEVTSLATENKDQKDKLMKVLSENEQLWSKGDEQGKELMELSMQLNLHEVKRMSESNENK